MDMDVEKYLNQVIATLEVIRRDAKTKRIVLGPEDARFNVVYQVEKDSDNWMSEMKHLLGLVQNRDV